MKTTITVNDVCDLLNEMLILDYDCVKKLVNVKVECNENIANHPSIMVRKYHIDDYFPTVGFVGVLNGLFYESGKEGAICYEVDENGKILKFRTTIGGN